MFWQPLSASTTAHASASLRFIPATIPCEWGRGAAFRRRLALAKLSHRTTNASEWPTPPHSNQFRSFASNFIIVLTWEKPCT